MNRVEKTVAKLEVYFDVVKMGPPVSEARIAEAEADYWGRPMAGLCDLYRCCDGLDVGLRDDVVGQILAIEQSVGTQDIDFGARHPRFWPVRADGCGDYDCVVFDEGIGAGSVVFYDHDYYDGAAAFLGSSFETYFELLAGRLTTVYLPNGEMDPRYRPPALPPSRPIPGLETLS